jgi:hypothetical protein
MIFIKFTSFIKLIRLMLCRKLINVYYENRKKDRHSAWKMQCFWVLVAVVHIVTTKLQRVEHEKIKAKRQGKQSLFLWKLKVIAVFIKGRHWFVSWVPQIKFTRSHPSITEHFSIVLLRHIYASDSHMVSCLLFLPIKTLHNGRPIFLICHSVLHVLSNHHPWFYYPSNI